MLISLAENKNLTPTVAAPTWPPALIHPPPSDPSPYSEFGGGTVVLF